MLERPAQEDLGRRLAGLQQRRAGWVRASVSLLGLVQWRVSSHLGGDTLDDGVVQELGSAYWTVSFNGNAVQPAKFDNVSVLAARMDLPRNRGQSVQSKWSTETHAAPRSG